VVMPPLRDRASAIELLAGHFCGTLAEQNGRPGLTLGRDALGLLERQSWPGNVRQLQNFVERLVVLSDAEEISAADVERELGREARPPASASGAPDPREEEPNAPSLKSKRHDAEREAVLDALQRANQNRTVAARILGVSRRTLYNKLGELDL